MTLGRGDGGRPPDRDVRRQPTTRGGRTRGGDGAVPTLLASGRGPVTLTRAGARAVFAVAVARAMGVALAVAVAAGGGGGEGKGVDWWWRG